MNNQMGNYNQNYNNNYNNYNNNGYNQFNNKNQNSRLEDKRKIIISILGLAILVVAIIGISFAAYKNIIVTKNANSISTGAVTVSFSEGNSAINLKNAIPITDEKGKTDENNSFDFVVTTSTTSNQKIPYVISITTDEGNTLDNSGVKVYLLKDNEEVVSPRLVSSLEDYSSRENSKILYKTQDIFENKKETKKTHYKLKIWLDKDFIIDEDGAKTFKMKVNVDSSLNENE